MKLLSNLSFRKKILISYIGVFLLFITLMFPFAQQMVHGIVLKSMDTRATELIERIQTAHDDSALVESLRDQRPLIFHRVGIITNEHKMLYDSHTRRLLGKDFRQDLVVEHPEVVQALKYGTGYHEEYSALLGQEFAYFAKTFDFHGKTYILRTAVPYRDMIEMRKNFEVGFLMLGSGILLLFSAMTWFIIHRLTLPINYIIKEIKPYQDGKETLIPEIRLSLTNPNDDFGRLATTLNSLAEKVRVHINSLIAERNEKGAILESLIEGVIAIDHDMRIVYTNSMALKLLDVSSKALIGNSISVIDQLPCFDLVRTCLIKNEPQTCSVELRKEGRRLYLDLVAMPTADQGGAILVLQDQSSHHKMVAMRKDFVANASHELKTPITIIRGFAEALYDNPDFPTEKRKEITEKIVRNCSRMAAIIKDLLILSDIENLPSTRIVDTDMLEVVEHCRSMLLELYPNTQFTVNTETDSDFRLLADPYFIELALTNLMVNAAKYSHEPATITVSLVKKDDSIHIAIADKGIGIAPKDQERVFQRFYTADKTHSRMKGGSGLGLSIVETIVEKHCGKVHLESALGVGSTFTLSFPVGVLRD